MKAGNASSATGHQPRWRRRKDDRPREILDAALEVFLDKGFSATRLEDIAEKAKVTKGTLFIYFENKEELFKSMVRDSIAQTVAKTDFAHVQPQATAQETFHLVAQLWRKHVSDSSLGKIPKMVVSEANNFPELAKEYIQNIVAPVRNLLVESIKQGVAQGELREVDPVHSAQLFLDPLVMSLIWRHSLGKFDKGLGKLPADYVETHARLFLSGILKAPV